jgi:hypothetical protein
MSAAAERHPGKPMSAALRFFGEAQGIEAVRIGPDLRHVMSEQRIDADHGTGRDRVAFEIEIADGASPLRHRRLQAHGFLERHFGQVHGFKIVEARGLIGGDAQRADFVAQPGLPMRMARQRPNK